MHHDSIVYIKLWEYWWRSGTTRVSHHCDLGSIPASSSYRIEVTLVTCGKSLTLPSITGFLQVLRFSPVVTLNP